MRSNKGITLMVLAITTIVLLILVSMISYTSYNVLDNAKLEVFTTELKIMQQEVNMLYQKIQTGDGTIQIGNTTYNIIQNDENNYPILGKDINNDIDYETAFKGAGGISEEDKSNYRYYDKDTIKLLELEGVDQEFLVNVETQMVISLTGFEQNGAKYYTLKQLSESYNVKYVDPHEDNTISFSYSTKKKSDNLWEIEVTITQLSKYVSQDDYTIEYQLQGTDYWTKAEGNPFLVDKSGTYNIKVTDLSGNSRIEENILVSTP